MKNEMYLSSFSLAEPEDGFYLYYPHWLNAWEAHLYNQALNSTATNGWGFKRFGTDKNIYAREMIRKPNYIDYIESLEQVSETALYNMGAKERMLLLKSRTAFIYVDAWGESSVFENITSGLHTSTIDTLPKNILKKFSIKNVTCKIRGEKFALIQAMQLAQDYLSWDVFDFVIVCSAYRAIPILAFSGEDISERRRKIKQQHKSGVNLTVERTGCFIFSRQESPLKVSCGRYIPSRETDCIFSEMMAEAPDISTFAYLGRRKNLCRTKSKAAASVVDLIETYGASGCITPALSWEYLRQRPSLSGTMRTMLSDNFGGYSFFDTRCSEGWR